MQDQLEINLPRLISDGMVLQRDSDIKIWGWATAGDTLTITFLGKQYRTDVNAAGEWQVIIQTSKAGGPYEMVFENAKGYRITISDILLGDVWVCSGQSNMEMKMLTVKSKYPEVVSEASNPFIRQFAVPVTYDFHKQQDDYEVGSWDAVSPDSILNFSAVAYFFADALYEKYNIPIGIVNASLGGSPAQAWVSEDALFEFPEYQEALVNMRNDAYVEEVLSENQRNAEDWYRKVNQEDIGIPETGTPFFSPSYDASDWLTTYVPSYWEEEGIGSFHGVVWFRKDIMLTSELLNNPAVIFMGHVVDEDTVYINGTKIGSIPFQYAPRKYDIPEGVLKEGINTIVVRVVNSSGKGGFYKGKPYHLQIGNEKIDLCGEWQYRIGKKSIPMPPQTFVSWQPTGLFNAMIAPLLKYKIKGVLWYQGETNAQNPENYESLLKSLIHDWRQKWGINELLFLIVQLPNFDETFKASSGNWPMIREAQRRALTLPGTGMAITIDIGEWNDVHPLNKKDVGYRLALLARKLAYGENHIVTSGPLLYSAQRDGSRVVLTFSNIGSGLITNDKEHPTWFEIAGEDKAFVNANATIKGDCVIVKNRKVSKPIYVRYAWADNPEGVNLYNKEGLPASPFVTELI